MAIGTPSESPAITVTEIDRSGVVPNVQTTTGAFVGNFNWGPVQQATLVSNETSLVDTFGSPDSSNTIEFHSAAYFLRYTNSLQVVREVTSAAFNSYDSDANATVLVKNRDKLKNYLKQKKIPTIIYYPKALSDQKIFNEYKSKNNKMNNSRILAKRIISLPFHLSLKDKQLRYITDCINNFYIKK